VLDQAAAPAARSAPAQREQVRLFAKDITSASGSNMSGR
jgi:hypothetical protein